MALLGGLSSFTGASSSDTDILSRFLHSQALVEQVDQQIDLRQIYSKPHQDFFFRLDPKESIEGLTDYWQKMVRVFYDNSTGLIELRIHAFEAKDAQRIAQTIFDDAASMINHLSEAARKDATHYARLELGQANERLTAARIALTSFRSRAQILDPVADLQGQMGLLNSLQQQETAALIEVQLLRDTARAGDPRIAQATRRMEVIKALIETERRKLGGGTQEKGAEHGGNDLSAAMGNYERLRLELEFAEKSYLAAQTTYDAALAEALRKSRYLAAYSGPTLAQEPLYPLRAWLSFGVFAFALLLWAITVLIYYSLRDRR